MLRSNKETGFYVGRSINPNLDAMVKIAERDARNYLKHIEATGHKRAPEDAEPAEKTLLVLDRWPN